MCTCNAVGNGGNAVQLAPVQERHNERADWPFGDSDADADRQTTTFEPWNVDLVGSGMIGRLEGQAAGGVAPVAKNLWLDAVAVVGGHLGRVAPGGGVLTIRVVRAFCTRRFFEG